MLDTVHLNKEAGSFNANNIFYKTPAGFKVKYYVASSRDTVWANYQIAVRRKSDGKLIAKSRTPIVADFLFSGTQNEVKLYSRFTKIYLNHTFSWNGAINGKMYTVKKKGDDWDEYNWNKMMLVPIGKNTLVVNSDYSSVGKAVNEDNLRALLAGDNVKRAQTRKLDLETKLKVAEQKVKDAEQSLKDAQEEVVRLRSELDGIGKRGTRRV